MMYLVEGPEGIGREMDIPEHRALDWKMRSCRVLAASAGHPNRSAGRPFFSRLQRNLNI